MSDVPGVLPLFPLPNVVLFPRMPMPLHVFEPRYRKMVEDVMDAGRTIGMVLLKPGWEANYHGRPPIYPVGCAGRIEQCERLEGGRYNIVLQGTTRVRIVEEHAGEPYRLARVEPLPEVDAPAEVMDEARRRLLAAIARAEDGPALLVLQGSPSHEVFVNAVSQTLALAPVEKQSLLDCDGPESRCARLVEILEFRHLEAAHGRRGPHTVH